MRICVKNVSVGPSVRVVPCVGEVVEIFLLAVSNKKNIEKMLKRSAEHKVHASTLDRLEWQKDGEEELDLSEISSTKFTDFKKKSMMQYKNQPPDVAKNGWSKDTYRKRISRATIYDFRIANMIEPNDLPADYNVPGVLKLQKHQKKLLDENKQHFLLEGVAGTGKTTIL